jgi:dipeptidyl aminopeptidase/acylaminoacyl peptidase
MQKYARSFPETCVKLLLIIILWPVCFLLSLSIRAEEKRPITVTDIVEMTRLGNPEYFFGASSADKVANYSPDNKHFVVLLRKGNLADNANEYSMYLFTTASVFQSSHPRLLMTFSSSTNSPAISGLKWLSDNQTVTFLGERGGGVAEVYTLNVITKRLQQKTSHATSIDHFDISSDGKELVFTAQQNQHVSLTPEQRRNGLVVQNQTLEDIYAGRFNYTPLEEELYLQDKHEKRVDIPSSHQINHFSRVSLSPNGKYAFITAYFRDPDRLWARYDNHSLQFNGSGVVRQDRAATNVAQYFLLDCHKGAIEPLLRAPALYSSQEFWSSDGDSVLIKSFLPLDNQTSKEYTERTKDQLPAKVSVPDERVTRLTDEEWQQAHQVHPAGRPLITLEEGTNTPPKIFAYDEVNHRRIMLMDLNPQFSGLRLGRVRELNFTVRGIPLIAGLYLPPDYEPGKRYPLVIQTHGYDPNRFSMDGREEWSSAFAARALAASGIVVVQMENFRNPKDHDKVSDDQTLGTTPEVRFRNLAVSAYEKAIESLDHDGLIDSDKIGISGFSRTVWFVSYFLTHSKTRVRTAILTDGVDSSYFEYIAKGLKEFDLDNGGKAPFGNDGLCLWMQEAPGFNLDKIHLPVRLVSLSDPTSLWEWFEGLKLQGKPVEMIAIPGSSHMLEKPLDRQIAMQGLVDWYRYWLQTYRDPSPVKADQYKRWNDMRQRSSGADKSIPHL